LPLSLQNREVAIGLTRMKVSKIGATRGALWECFEESKLIEVKSTGMLFTINPATIAVPDIARR